MTGVIEPPLTGGTCGVGMDGGFVTPIGGAGNAGAGGGDGGDGTIPGFDSPAGGGNESVGTLGVVDGWLAEGGGKVRAGGVVDDGPMNVPRPSGTTGVIGPVWLGDNGETPEPGMSGASIVPSGGVVPGPDG